jgi:hypothetical protein
MAPVAPGPVPNVNRSVHFSSGQVPTILRRMERFLGIPLSLRSITGEVVAKTDYFSGPCSLIRGTDLGRLRCRNTYHSIEEKLLRRKVPIVTFCYAGFLVFAVPLNFRGEMLGTLIGSQILPLDLPRRRDLVAHFEGTLKGLKIEQPGEFYHSFTQVRAIRPDFHRVSFLAFLDQLGENFIKMAFAEKTWGRFYKEMLDAFPKIEIFRGVD